MSSCYSGNYINTLNNTAFQGTSVRL